MSAEATEKKQAVTNAREVSASEAIVINRALWANSFRVLLGAAIGGWVVAAVLGFTDYKLATRPVPTRYFEAIDGRLVQAVPVSQPMLSESEILTGAMNALEAGFNMNFHDYRMRIEEASKWFTPAGFAAYRKALFASGNMTTLKQKRLVLSIAITGAPVIVQKGILAGTHTYAWKIQVPVKVYYQGSGYESNKAHLVTLIIVRQNNLAVPRGWAVDSFVFGPMPQSAG